MTSFDRPPRALRKAKLDNLVLVPASMLPFKEQYQQLANEQQQGTTVVILPAADSPTRTTLEAIAATHRAKGRQVATVSRRSPSPLEIASQGGTITEDDQS
jgi:flavorubredoxin